LGDNEEEKTEFPNAGKDKELEEEKQAALDAEREEHNRRTGGGSYPTASDR
jgi:hypothetical protein